MRRLNRLAEDVVLVRNHRTVMFLNNHARNLHQVIPVMMTNVVSRMLEVDIQQGRLIHVRIFVIALSV